MNKTYLFYDIETTGLNPCFDQVLQFAAIRTDLELRELERYDFNVKLNCDVIPAPGAIITHHIGIGQCQTGIPELTAITQIHKLLNTPGTISIGYNTLGFDDEFLRFSFYRNLLSPYTHQFANECSRMDLYPLTIMYYLFKPSILKIWPQYNEKPTLKLEHLSIANQLAEGQAHTAMVDVEATLALAKKMIQERDMWDYLAGYFDKKTDLSRMMQLDAVALLVDGKFGPKNNYLAPVLKLGPHYEYKNQDIWLRLDLDMSETPYIIRKKSGENELLLPMKSRYLEKISLERRALAQKNKAWLEENPAILTDISEYHRRYIYPKFPNIDADAALYEIGFPKPTEENLFQKFHQAPAEKKMIVANQFPNAVRKEQALRIMGRHFFNDLTPEQKILFDAYIQKAIHSAIDHSPLDYRGQHKLSIPLALAESTTLQNTPLSDKQKALLAEFDDYYTKKRV